VPRQDARRVVVRSPIVVKAFLRRYVAFGGFSVLLVAGACSSSMSNGSSHSDAGSGARTGAGGTGGVSSGGSSTATGGTASGGTASGGTSEVDASRDAGTPIADAAPDANSPSTDASDGGRRGRYLWQLSYDQSFAAHVAIDSKGAAIVSGTFFDTKDISLGAFSLKSHGSADVMLSRVLANGAVDWARGYGGTAEDYPVTFTLDGDDRIFLTGLYNGTGNIGGPDFPAFAGNPGRYDVYVAGLAANGDYRWDKTINTDAEAFGASVALDGSGDALVAGSFLGTAKIGGVSHASAGGWDAFVARYDEPDGTLGAATVFGGAGDDKASVALYTGSDVVVIGTFSGAVTFPTTPMATTLTSAGGTDVFVARVSTSGVMSRVVAFGGSGDEVIAQAHLDGAGNVVLAGSFDSPTLSVLGGKALSSAGGDDFFVAKLSPSLAHVWSTRFGGDADDLVRDLAVMPDGSLAITGEFRNRLTIGDRTFDASRAADAGPASAIDIFVAELDANGNPLWSFATGGPAPDRGLGVALDASGALYLTATFQSAVDFGGGATLTPAPGQWDSALVKYSAR
jgi:hypothetical protein